ncbi:MerR family transcriptional regulator [Hoeflea prorocentri]|uniref:MerR family transcriptional regulator n=1 Tax=Hoeflea prorocentri TaxID=1922333 RepID=A0A9X3UL68_9HYPH|nr:MerR family transcriptional regulator [Hoeflea prorocentri]MCY6381229.1 MerR family transcriptional regulator [Hoeflea prorocentri]MDA5399029.1 MerR family transcriptional regulator [Hoeflea prorocentri]
MDKSPDAFRTISEVADELDLPQHVLRFWETRFNQIKPMKRGGGRRYYRPDDVDLLKGIRHLLYDQGYTIKGVQKLLKQNGSKFAVAIGSGEVTATEALASFTRQEAAEPPEPQEEASSGESDPDGDQLVGQAKLPGGRFFGIGGGSAKDGEGGSMAKEDKELLQEALYDLLECKRLLDQVR